MHTFDFSHDELELLHRAVDLLQRQDAIADDMDTAVALDNVYCRLRERLDEARNARYICVGDLWRGGISLTAIHNIQTCLATPPDYILSYETDGVTNHGTAPAQAKPKRRTRA